MFKRFINDESGQSMTEYVLIVFLVAVAVVVIVKVFGNQITNLFTESAEKIESETGVSGN